MTFAAKKMGLPPGTIISLADDSGPVRISYIKYSENTCSEALCGSIEEVFLLKDSGETVWVNVEGTSDISIFEKIVEAFGVDRLVVEDILDYDTRPRFEVYDGYAFAAAKMLYREPGGYVLEEHVSFLLISNMLFTFQFKHGDVFDKVRDRIRSAGGRIRLRKADYLLYALLDVMVDNYFWVLDLVEGNIVRTEDEILGSSGKESLGSIRRLKKEALLLRKAIFPLKEAIFLMLHAEEKVFEKRTLKYLKELHEHIVQVAENTENVRDMANGLMDVHISTSNTRLGNITKVLTIVSAVFIPLNLLAGIYGMNFEVLPLKDHPYGFLIVIMSMILIASVLFLYFRFKKWF